MNRWISLALLIAACGKNSPKGSAPAAPAGLQATGAGPSISLSWTASAGATGYSVLRGAASGGPYSAVATPNATTYTDTSLQAGATYYYVVQASNDFGSSGNSNEASAITAPPVPAGLTATATGSSITVSWTAAPGATGYSLSRATAAAGPYTALATPTATTYSDSGLNAGATYYYKVNASNASGASADSAEAHDTTAPPTPTGLIVGASGTTISVSWNAAAGATGYGLSRATAAAGPYSRIATPSGTSYSDTGLTPGTTYYYKISAINPAGSSADSAEAHATVGVNAPATPTGFTAVATGNTIALSWTAVAGATGYSILRSASAAGPFSALATSTTNSYSNTGLAAGTTYYYEVTATNAGGSSTPSLPAGDTTAPATPTGLTAVASGVSVTVSWTAASGAAGYALQRATAATGPYSALANPSASPYVDSGLAAGTTYYYQIAASNPAGTSAFSSEAHDTTVPPVPAGLNAVASGTQIALTWTAAPAATGYVVSRSTAAAGTYTQIATPTAASYTDSASLALGTTYYYKVAGSNGAGAGAASGAVSATTVPPAPTGVVATPGDSQVGLTWAAAQGAASYDVLKGPSGSEVSIGQTITGTSTNVTSLTNGTQVCFLVQAVNPAGHSASSSPEICATPNVVPSAPTGLTAVATGTAIQLNWTAPTGATSYSVTRSTSSTGTYAEIATPSSVSYNDTGLAAGTTYYYKVAGKNSAGTGPYAGPANATTVPLMPTGLTAVATGTTIALNWSAATGATGYTLQRAVGAGSYSAFSTPTTNSASDTGLTPGTTYHYQVAATNNAGTSAYSGPAQDTAIPPLPTVTASAMANSVTLNYSAAGATSYQVKKGPTGGPYNTTVSCPSGSPCTDASVSPGTTYYYVVIATNSAGSAQSSPETAIITVPLPPTTLTTQHGDTNIALTWSASTGAQTYNVWSCSTTNLSFTCTNYTQVPSNQGGTTTAPTVTTTVTGLTNQTVKYCFVVQAVDASGPSANSPSACDIPTNVPAAPTLSATEAVVSGNPQVSLSWTTISNATSYVLTRNPSGGPFPVTQSTTSYGPDTGVAFGIQYEYWVNAKNVNGTSPDSNHVKVTPLAAPVVTAIGLNNKVNLSWPTLAGAANYDIFRGTTSGGETALINTSGTSYSDTLVSNGSTYYYQVRATCDPGAGCTASTIVVTGNKSTEVKTIPAVEICLASDAPYIWVVDANTAGEQDVRRTFGGSTMLLSPAAVAVDSANAEIYVANAGANSITVYNLTDRGDISPKRIIAGASTLLTGPNAIALDLTNHLIYVASGTGLQVFRQSDSGAVAPLRHLDTGGPFIGVAVDPTDAAKGLYVSTTDTVSRYALVASGTDGPAQFMVGASAPWSAFTVDFPRNEMYLGDSTSTVSIFNRSWVGNIGAPGVTPPSTITGLTPTNGLVMNGSTLVTAHSQKLVNFTRPNTGWPASTAGSTGTTIADTTNLIALPSGVAVDTSTGNVWYASQSTFAAAVNVVVPSDTSLNSYTGIHVTFSVNLAPIELGPAGIVADAANDKLWVASGHPLTTLNGNTFQFDRTGLLHNNSPLITYTGRVKGVALDTTDSEVFVSVDSSTPAIDVYPRTGGGAKLRPSFALNPATAAGRGFGMWFDGGQLFVAQTGTNSVLIFNRAADGALSAATPAAITGSNTLLSNTSQPNAVYADSTEILVSTSNGHVYGYSRSALGNGNVAPARDINQSSDTTVAGTWGVIKDGSGNIYTGNTGAAAGGWRLKVFSPTPANSGTLSRTITARGVGNSAYGLAFCN
jgi:fibronectin type 3 domain-containing protein